MLASAGEGAARAPHACSKLPLAPCS